MDQLRNLVASYTWISINLRQSTLTSTLVLLTERTGLPTQKVTEKGKKCLYPASGGYYKRMIAEGREGSKGCCRGFGHNLLRNAEVSFVQMQLSQVHSDTGNTQRQVYNLL